LAERSVRKGRRELIHRESFRASVLHLSEIQAVLQSIAEKKCLLTTPSFLSMNSLHRGEAQAIFLAQQTPDSLLIIDEREGRAEARRRGIAITGLLGVIRDAAIRGHIDFEGALKKLKATDFRLSNEIEAIVREQYKNSRTEG
jgi:predicted nucleic acid-binding protein